MNELRWILLIAGIIILAAIYVLGHKQQLRRRRRWREEAESAEETADVSFDTRADREDIGPEPESLERLQEMLEEEAEARVVYQAGSATAPEPESKPRLRQIKPNTAERPAAVDDKIISLYIVARRPAMFRGEAIRDAAERLHLEYGEMRLFNRVIERNRRRRILFSLANAVKPGAFDAETLHGLTTPGLVLFMQLPGPLEGLKSFNAMLDCAQRLAMELDGELQDETHSVLGNQTIDHMREEIQLFSLRTARMRRTDRAP